MKCTGSLIVMVAAIILLPASSWAQVANKPSNKNRQEDVAGKIADLDRAWLSAAAKYDTDYLSQLFADDFVEVHPDGTIVNKEQQLAQIKAPGSKIDELHADDIRVHYLSEDVAILTDTSTIRAHMLAGGRGAKELITGGKYKVIRIFIKQDGKWRAAGAGLTQIPSE